MKLSEFRKLIREEVRTVLNEKRRVRTFESFIKEASASSEVKLTIPQLGQLKVGDKVTYLGKDVDGFKSGEEYEVSRKESSSTFQPTITIKNIDGKKLRTSNLSK